MKFLEKPSTEQKEEIKVNKLYTMAIQCASCDEWDSMQGGPVDGGKAKFLCSKCGKINIIEWKFDF